MSSAGRMGAGGGGQGNTSFRLIVNLYDPDWRRGRSKGGGKGGEGDPRCHSAAVSALCACSVLPRCKKFVHLIYANVIAFTSHRLPLLLPLAPISRVQVFFLCVFFLESLLCVQMLK